MHASWEWPLLKCVRERHFKTLSRNRYVTRDGETGVRRIIAKRLLPWIAKCRWKRYAQNPGRTTSRKIAAIWSREIPSHISRWAVSPLSRKPLYRRSVFHWDRENLFHYWRKFHYCREHLLPSYWEELLDSCRVEVYPLFKKSFWVLSRTLASLPPRTIVSSASRGSFSLLSRCDRFAIVAQWLRPSCREKWTSPWNQVEFVRRQLGSVIPMNVAKWMIWDHNEGVMVKVHREWNLCRKTWQASGDYP